MSYLLLILSLTANGILIWYIKTLIKRYLIDLESVDKFNEMLGQYADSLNSIYKLEELYGDEILKKAINQTNFVIEACKEMRGGLADSGKEQEREEETTEAASKEESIIRLREGEKVTQSADKYKRVVVS